MRQFSFLALLLAVLASLLLHSPLAAQAPIMRDVTSPLGQQLSAIASAALHSPLDTLTQTQQGSSVPRALYQNTMQGPVADAHARRQFLGQYGLHYTDYRLEMTPLSLEQKGRTLVLRARSYTVLTLQLTPPDPLAPTTTEYENEHLFTFQQVNREWALINHEELKPPQTVTATEGEQPHIAPSEIQASDPAQLDSVPSAALGINRSAVVNYAYSYWKNYNTDYRSFEKDCTNFASQALKHGGWAHTSGGATTYKSTNEWWYRWYKETWTWVNAQYFHQFLVNKGRGYTVTTFTNTSPAPSMFNGVSTGDILQADWHRDGIYDHTMIITKKDSTGYIYLTYHSNNTLNKHILDLVNGNPNARWRLVRIY